MAMNEQEAAVLEYLMSVGATKPQDEQRARQQQQIDMLRKQSSVTPQGSYTQTNSAAAPPIFVAPNPLGTAANAAGQGIAAYQQGQLNNANVQAGNDQTMQFEQTIRRLRQQGQPPKSMDTADYGGSL